MIIRNKNKFNIKNLEIIENFFNIMDIICENLDAMLTLKSQNKDVQATLNELFPQLVGENGFAFQKLFKIAFDNCESKERAMRLMNESIEALEIVTYDQINVIMWFSNDFSVCKFLALKMRIEY